MDHLRLGELVALLAEYQEALKARRAPYSARSKVSDCFEMACRDYAKTSKGQT